MAQVTKGQLDKLKQSAMKMATRAKGLQERAEEAMGHVVQTVEIGVAAFAAGMIEGRFGGVEVVGVPVDLGLGVVGHVLGFVGLAGKHSAHVHNFSDGFIASYLMRLGAGIGSRMEGAPQRRTGLDLPGDTEGPSTRIPAQSQSTGGGAAAGAQGFTDKEVARMVNQR